MRLLLPLLPTLLASPPLPERHDYDVVVVGATPSGVMAAVAAARAGRATLLLEPSAYVGGMMAAGLGVTDYGVHGDTIGGQAVEFFRRVAAHYGVAFAYPPAGGCSVGGGAGWVFEPHVAEDILRQVSTTACSLTVHS